MECPGDSLSEAGKLLERDIWSKKTENIIQITKDKIFWKIVTYDQSNRKKFCVSCQRLSWSLENQENIISFSQDYTFSKDHGAGCPDVTPFFNQVAYEIKERNLRLTKNDFGRLPYCSNGNTSFVYEKFGF